MNYNFWVFGVYISKAISQTEPEYACEYSTPQTLKLRTWVLLVFWSRNWYYNAQKTINALYKLQRHCQPQYGARICLSCFISQWLPPFSNSLVIYAQFSTNFMGSFCQQVAQMKCANANNNRSYTLLH